MAAPRKPTKAAQLRDQLENSSQPYEKADRRDFSTYNASDSVSVSLRLTAAQKRDLEAYAQERGLKLGQLVRQWILERKRKEGA